MMILVLDFESKEREFYFILFYLKSMAKGSELHPSVPSTGRAGSYILSCHTNERRMGVVSGVNPARHCRGSWCQLMPVCHDLIMLVPEFVVCRYFIHFLSGPQARRNFLFCILMAVNLAKAITVTGRWWLAFAKARVNSHSGSGQPISALLIPRCW